MKLSTFFAVVLATGYRAKVNDFMENTLDKAGGVGKLMKLGRSSFEKATNRNLLRTVRVARSLADLELKNTVDDSDY